MSIVVLGSINIDLVVRTPRLPIAGETLAGHTFFTAPGGKGANQAVACARLGAPTRMVGRVGNDLFGETLRGALSGYGVDTTDVTVTEGKPSGVAVIAVDDRAENTIIIVAGANGEVGPDDIRRLDRLLDNARVLLLQLEVPLDTVIAAAQTARRHNVMVILDPAPARPLPPELYRLVDIITPNETETAVLTGHLVENEENAKKAALVLLERGVRRAIIKMGSKGAFWADESGSQFVPALKVVTVDTVAAGDAFNGGLAVALSDGRPFPEAVRWGVAAGAASVTKAGAQPSMPDRHSIEALLR